MKLALSRARVGLLVFIGVITFVVGIFLVGQKSQLFSPTFRIRVNFENAEGVKPGSIVVMNGYAIGAVTEIDLTPNADSVRLTLRVNEAVHPFIKHDSRAEVKQEGLVGNKFINLLVGTPALPPIEPDGFVQGVPPFALNALTENISAISDTARRVSGQVYELLGRVLAGKGTLGRLLNDDGVYVTLERLVAHADTGLAGALGQIDRLSDVIARLSTTAERIAQRADTSIAATSRITSQLETLVRNLNAGRGTLGALLVDRALYDSLRTLVGALTDATLDAGAAADQAERSIHAMREHWLFGRIFGGPDMASEPQPESSYQKRMRELERRARELDRREEALREREGAHPPAKDTR